MANIHLSWTDQSRTASSQRVALYNAEIFKDEVFGVAFKFQRLNVNSINVIVVSELRLMENELTAKRQFYKDRSDCTKVFLDKFFLELYDYKLVEMFSEASFISHVIERDHTGFNLKLYQVLFQDKVYAIILQHFLTNLLKP
jgi:hypothetical protein